MFTGLVEEKGVVVARTSSRGGSLLRIKTALPTLVLGESISVDGVCLTVAKLAADAFEADVSSETLARTTLGRLSPGGSVNLERSLAIGARLGGHIVSGHVDGTCTLVTRSPLGDAIALSFRFEPHLARFIAEKGSVAVNGVSLTVNAVSSDTFDVAIIPHTRDKTNLEALGVGSSANLEVDLLARYLARLLDVRTSSPLESKDAQETHDAWLQRLARAGLA